MGGRRSSPWGKQKRALCLLLAVIVAVVSAFLQLKETHYANAFGLFMIVFGFLIWLLATQVEGYEDVAIFVELGWRSPGLTPPVG